MADQGHAIINQNDHLLLDQPLLRLPNELLRKCFRSAHFTIEKETTAVKTLLKDTANKAVAGQASQEDVLKNIESMITRMRGVKRKLAASAQEEAQIHDQVGARVSHLEELYSMNTVDDVRYEAWNRKRLDRLMTDYMLRHGYIESASGLALDRGIEKLVDVDTFVSMSRIRDSLLGGSVIEALAWCSENKKELRKMESKLEFMLRFQQYIELVRTQSPPKLLEAIIHAKKYLIPNRASFPVDLQKACGLLAFPPQSPASSIYADLYKPSRWTELADLFTETHNQLLGLPSIPLLHIALSSGLSALKTPACHSSSTQQNLMAASTNGHGVCPICSTELNELARNIPYAHHTQSHVEHDLRLLPNGQVCGKARLEEQARKAGLSSDKVKDPRTGAVYPLEALKKVFIT